MIQITNCIKIICLFVAGLIPKPDKNHLPQSNGCGSLGLEVIKDIIMQILTN